MYIIYLQKWHKRRLYRYVSLTLPPTPTAYRQTVTKGDDLSSSFSNPFQQLFRLTSSLTVSPPEGQCAPISSNILNYEIDYMQCVPRKWFGSAVVTLYTLSHSVHYQLIRILFETHIVAKNVSFSFERLPLYPRVSYIMGRAFNSSTRTTVLWSRKYYIIDNILNKDDHRP